MNARHFVTAGELSRPAPEVTAAIAQRYLEAARQAFTRLQAGEDTEALHDLRVALRQLRSTFRAYPDCLPQVGRKLQKKLKRTARATGPARDTEVQLAYLQGWLERMLPDQLPGGQWLQRQLRRREARAYAHSREVLEKRFDKLARHLSRRLAGVLPEAAGEGYGPRLAQELRTAGEDFRRRLRRLAVHEDDADLHAVRIAGKRLRYLITPLDKQLVPVSDLLTDLKGIQDLLGEYHDMMVFEETLLELAPEAATDSARHCLRQIARGGTATPAQNLDLMPGLYQLGERMAQRKQTLARQVLDHETGGDYRQLFARLDELIATAATPAGQA